MWLCESWEYQTCLRCSGSYLIALQCCIKDHSECAGRVEKKRTKKINKKQELGNHLEYTSLCFLFTPLWTVSVEQFTCSDPFLTCPSARPEPFQLPWLPHSTVSALLSLDLIQHLAVPGCPLSSTARFSVQRVPRWSTEPMSGRRAWSCRF